MKISITRALTEIKVIKSRIEKEIGNTGFFAVKVGNTLSSPYSHLKPEDFIKETKREVQSIKDLINRLYIIKNAIDQSNSVTKVKVGEKEMTIVEVLAAKSFLSIKKQMLNTLKTDYRHCSNDVEKRIDENRNRIDRLVDQEISTMGAKTVSKEDKENIYKRYKDMIESNNAVELVDPDNYVEYIKELEEEINLFEKEIDYTLSESNATTFIEIPD